MAAVDLPINDEYLSHLHQVRNARKAAAARVTSFSLSAPLDSLDEMSSTASATSAVSSATATGIAADSSSSLDIRTSDTAILSQYPSSIVRLLVLLAPAIDLSTKFIRLATWTAGPGTASHSFLLLLSWWAVCLYGYEIIRYAPQAVLLTIIVYNGLLRAHQGINNKATTKSKTVSSDNINKTIDNLAELADFFSTFSSTLLEPIFALFTWNSYQETKALTIFLITTWPIWVLCFGQHIWDFFRLPRVVFEARRYVLKGFSFISPTLHFPSQRGLTWGRQHWPTLFGRSDYLQSQLARIITSVDPITNRITGASFRLFHSSSIQFTILPPFPLFSLGVRHLLLILGTLALTWCSPWCALIRHALWRSALVRQSTRKAVALFSGKRPSSLYSSLSLHNTLTSSPGYDSSPFDGQITSKPSTAKDTATSANKDITRHEDVIYRFTIFENQRWWMGLDWTAALLPQERPSWADESNNPVSPPSSFSLPPVKTTFKPAPTSSNPQAYVKRLVRWQWIDAEWTVAGRDQIGDALGLQTKNRRASSTSTTSGTLFSNSTINANNSEVDADDKASRRLSTSSALSNGGDLPSDLQWLDVDAEGWQYGDNSWEKMSRKSGLGRYTRKRRWIRRAVLVEVVHRNYSPTEEELHTSSEDNSKDQNGPLDVGSSPKSPTIPISPTTLPASPRIGGGGDLKQRLSRAAQGSSSSSKAVE